MQIFKKIDRQKNHTFLFEDLVQCFCARLYYFAEHSLISLYRSAPMIILKTECLYYTSLFGLGCPPPSTFTTASCISESFCMHQLETNTRSYAKLQLWHVTTWVVAMLYMILVISP